MSKKDSGYGKYPNYVANDPTFRHVEKSLLTVLAGAVNSKLGYGWMSVKEIALRTPCSEKTAYRSLKVLEERGVIVRDAYHVSNGISTKITRVILNK